MIHPFIIGEKLYLRPLEKTDLNEDYLFWVNDQEVTKYMTTGTFPTNMEGLERYYQQKLDTPTKNIILAIIDKESDKHIGNITLSNIDWVNRICELGIMIGDKSFRGKGYGTEATKLMISYAFRKLNLHKVWLGLFAEHESALKAYQNAGLQVEARFKDELYKDGKYHDRVVMGIYNTPFENK